METDEGNHKNKRAGRRSVWWRFQADNFDIEFYFEINNLIFNLLGHHLSYNLIGLRVQTRRIEKLVRRA